MDIDQAGKFPGLAASLPPSDTTNAAHWGGVFASITTGTVVESLVRLRKNQ